MKMNEDFTQELNALKTIFLAFQGLDDDTKLRIINYIKDFFELDC